MRKRLQVRAISWILSIILLVSLLTGCNFFSVENDSNSEIATENATETATEIAIETETESATETEIDKCNTETLGGEDATKQVVLENETEIFQNTAANVTQSNVDDQIKSICNSIITSGMSDFQKAMAIHDWLTGNISYDYSYSNYFVEETIRDRSGVCQGYALCFLEMATYVGLEATFVGGTANNGTGSGNQSHAWNQVKIDGTWYNVDVTWDDPTGADTPGYTYFLVSDASFNTDHFAEDTTKSCPTDYPRSTIYKAALSSGKYGSAFYASSLEEFNAGIESYMNSSATSVWVWYYDTSLNSSNCEAFCNTLMNSCKYYVASTSYYAPTDGITKYNFTIIPMSTWNSYSVATNEKEALSIIDRNYVAGGSYTFRYDSADKSFVFPPVNVPAKGYSYVEYNNGYSRLVTIYYN